MPDLSAPLRDLSRQLRGELHTGDLMRRLYATDASVYRELPLAVAIPKTEADLLALIHFAGQQGTSLIPRTAGTSLAGQCVGDGIVVDMSVHFRKILSIDSGKRQVKVQPGVIRDELNRALAHYGLFFGPNTSTANRAMIGGMVGNNSCGSTSIVYGSTRDHVRELKCLLSDGSPATFGPLPPEDAMIKSHVDNLEGRLYKQLIAELGQPSVQARIRDTFPKVGVTRRNTGYAVDSLLDCQPFAPEGEPFNFCRLLCGSEGTLALTTAIILEVDPLPPPHATLLCAHFASVHEAMDATIVAMAQHPTACELMDKVILDCTKDSLTYRQNRFFLEGDPAAVLVVEFRGEKEEEAQAQASACAEALVHAGLGYAYPIVNSADAEKVWDLRKAGLGLLSNVPGDAKPVACIEDTAVALPDLPAYIREFEQLMQSFGQQAVYYAHAGAGELHLRPMLNLKATRDRELFREITRATTELVKKYRGSLSGEHGDGRVRAEFIPHLLGEENMKLFRAIKQTWDPGGIFNPGKIVDAPPMDEDLRYESEQHTPEPDTLFDFSEVGGIVRMAEKCNGTADCRKLHTTGGTMCPSYQASLQEPDNTRARANALREYLSQDKTPEAFDHEELKEVLDRCLSCKGCTGECPSNVDVSAMKAEFLYQYQKSHPPSLRTKAFARIDRINSMAASFPALSNLGMAMTAPLLKRALGVAPERSLPKIAHPTWRKWWQRKGSKLKPIGPVRGRVMLYADEFTDLNDAHVGIAATRLLLALGYEVVLPEGSRSGRAQLSKGFLEEARALARANVEQFHGLASEQVPLIGIEPSAILGFRDEYPRLLRGNRQEKARELHPYTLLLEEFLAREARAGRIGPDDFSDREARILLHGHCHQKALSKKEDAIVALSLPSGHHVEWIPSGCCGMAGSFGYEKEHYTLSMQVGELVLFPAVRKSAESTIIAASGTSCRHQILDGTGRRAMHPAEVLWRALPSVDKLMG